MDNLPSLLGLALRAGRLAAGEEPVLAACKAHKAYLLMLASDAAENSVRRAERFSLESANTVIVTLPLTKDQMGAGLGRSSCAMAAVTDVEFAAGIVKKLAKADPEQYGQALEALSKKADRTKKRRDEKRAAQKNPRTGKGSAPRGQKKK